MDGLKKRMEQEGGSWVDEIPSVLYAYRTTQRTTTGETPFCLVYGAEVVAPAEIQGQAIRVGHFEVEKNDELLKEDSTFMEEIREQAKSRVDAY